MTKALTTISGTITQAAQGKRIREMDAEQILKGAAEKLASMCGIPTVTADEKEVFAIQVAKYYSELTLPEIRTAFELLCVGELDMYLPLDQNKQPDSKHYGKFSFAFWGKVLKAYKQKRAENKRKTAQPVALLEAPSKPTPEALVKLNDGYLDDVLEVHRRVYEGHPVSEWKLNSRLWELLQRMNMAPDDPDYIVATKAHEREAQQQEKRGRDYNMQQIINVQIENGVMSSKVKQSAEQVALRAAIRWHLRMLPPGEFQQAVEYYRAEKTKSIQSENG